MSVPSNRPDLPPGALDGIRVVELATILMGPYGARILGDYGADVVRIESLTGDSTRHGIPSRNPGMSGLNLTIQRNKRSVALDLKDPRGRDAALAIIATADVVVTNMRRAALGRLGLDPTELRDRHPELIVCVGNGYGSDGPYGDKAAYDDAIQAGSGLAWIVGQAQPSQEPGYVPAIMADKVCGMTIAQAVLAALVHKVRTGQGQEIEVPMLETMVAFNLVEHQRGHGFEPPMGTFGYTRLFSPNRRPFASADGWIAILPYNDSHWREFFTIIGQPELIDDPRFADHNARIANVDEAYGMVSDAAATKTTAEWLALCEEKSIPCSVVLNPTDAIDDPHLDAVGMIDIRHHPSEGPYRYIRDGPRLSETPMGLHRHAPRLGQHTREVLGDLGYQPAHIDDLVAEGVAVAEGEPN
ncbi:MAG: CoA transferase [Actinomycetia bacterium]|nr:CoA transferase [Actinomycetes bacterium]MCP4228429.1 CoA transferase [Actinomycetes bacterium]MCP5034536.1 CoA transferase [Actinomycetes bacterium]